MNRFPKIFTIFWIFSLLLSLIARPASAQSAVVSAAPAPAAEEHSYPLVHFSQMEYWPLLYGRYDIQSFLQEINSPLQTVIVEVEDGGSISFADALEFIAEQHNIHPRMLLVLLEVSSGKVTGTTMGHANFNLSRLGEYQLQDENAVLLRQLEEAARKLRNYIEQPQQQMQITNQWDQYSVASNALVDIVTLIEGTSSGRTASSYAMESFAAQFSSWFGPLHESAIETTYNWGTIQTGLPYQKGTYNGGPHGSSNMGNLSGLDFGSENNTVLNIAAGRLVSKGPRGGNVGNHVAIRIDGTNFEIQYWHLSEISPQLGESGDFVPKGFPIGTEGGTTAMYCTDSNIFTGEGGRATPCDPNSTPEEKLAVCKTGPYGGSIKSVSSANECLYAAHIHLELKEFESPQLPRTQSTWDERQLDNWNFFVHTWDQGRTSPWIYQGTAIGAGTATQTVQKDRGPDLTSYYAKVGDPETSDNTKYAQADLSSSNTQTDCNTASCPDKPAPVITSPTQNSVLQAGPYNDPKDSIAPIRVVVEGQFDTLPKDAFEVRIGGIVATIQGTVTPAGDYKIYELTVHPPTQPQNGLYDLEVRVNGIQATSAQSIRYGELVGVSYIVVLDTSRSMNCSPGTNPNTGCDANTVTDAKITSARATAETFVRLLLPQEYVGFIRFSPPEQVNDIEGTPEIASEVRKDELSNILRNIVGESGTPLYDAVISAVNRFAGNASSTKVAVVLSDGADSGSNASLDQAIQAAQQAGVQVCTVRFGTAANLSVLNRLSQETGCEAAQTAIDPAQLERAFQDIRTSASGLQTVQVFYALAGPFQKKEFLFQVDHLAEATFQVVWTAVLSQIFNDSTLKLTAPDGAEHTPSQPNGAEYIRGPLLNAFRIANPQTGTWKLTVEYRPGTRAQTSPEAADNSVPIEVALTGDSDLKLRTYSDSFVEAGNLLELGAKVANPDPITGATVLVSIERPSGSKVVMPLLDDGRHGDGFANDGYYSAAFYDTFQTGTYRLEYQVDGQSPDGTPFARFARRSVEVQGNAGQGAINISLTEGLNLIGLDGFAPTERMPGNTLLSISDAYTTVLSYNYPEGGIGFFTDLPEEINTLKEIDPFHGYWIRTTRPVTLEVHGPSLLQNVHIPVHPGWNLVPFLSAIATPVTEALVSIEGQYLGVRGYKDGAMSYWPQLPNSMNTLKVLEPNMGYWILMSDIHTILQYPEYADGPPDYDSTSTAVTVQSRQSFASSNQPQNVNGVTPTEQWIDLYSFDVIANGEPVPQGTVIAVYSPQGMKIGEATVHTPGWIGVLAAYGKSSFTNYVDGALPGEQLSFTINGHPATATDMFGNPVRWTSDGALQQIELSASVDLQDNSIFLPSVTR